MKLVLKSTIYLLIALTLVSCQTRTNTEIENILEKNVVPEEVKKQVESKPKQTAIIQDGETILHPKIAFRPQFTKTQSGVVGHINIAPGYYLYATKINLHTTSGERPESFSISGKSVKTKDIFGEVTVFRNRVNFIIVQKSGSSTHLLQFQGAVDGGVVYPPSVEEIKL